MRGRTENDGYYKRSSVDPLSFVLLRSTFLPRLSKRQDNNDREPSKDLKNRKKENIGDGRFSVELLSISSPFGQRIEIESPPKVSPILRTLAPRRDTSSKMEKKEK
jgi:hypothetical protein